MTHLQVYDCTGWI